ncbi:hypothetical protein JW898_03700 [Candidatus Woesearchaeota archaeon]|nr:hypothetical protein [Candidatus Woesearchaeota archaeon]
MKKTIIHFAVFLLLLPSIHAWARHDQMTAEVVRDLGWLDRFDEVAVTEYSYDDPSISQVRIRYYNPNPGQLGPSDFYYHALYEPVLFFKGAKLAEKTDARQILTDFSDEPDWEMDQNLDLSWMQGFSGESQGYRHMYYPTWSFHVPMGFIAQGQTPDRADHFYSMAKMAFGRGDTYWGFRYLARTLHYIQDMSQPYHTRQLYWRFISLKDPYYGTVQTIKNYHFAYESYQANLFRLEQQGAMPKRLVSALRYSLPVATDSPSDLAKYIARRSYWKSSGTMKSSIDFFGEKYLGPRGAAMTKEEFFEDIHRTDPAAEALHADIEGRMVLMGKATKSFLEFARKDLNLDEYQV